MFLEEVRAAAAYDLSPHGHAFINPYNGCSMGCPYCYWLKQEGWENRIQIRTNIAKLLEKELKEWPRDEWIYLGSVCDPFNELERKYRLTRDCLRVINEYEIPLLITTSGADSVLLDYIDILKGMKKVIVAVELSRIPFIEAMNRGDGHQGIAYANILNREGIKTWSTVSPVLPGIMQLDKILEELDKEIPVYISALDCREEDILGKRTLAWIYDKYPEFSECYERIIRKQDRSYFDETEKRFAFNERIKKFPFQINDQII